MLSLRNKADRLATTPSGRRVPLVARFLLHVACAALGTLVAACGTPAPAAVTVTTQAFRYQPADFEWQVGKPVKLTLRNPDSVEHDFVVDRLRFSVAAGAAAHGSHPTSSAGTAAPTPSPDSLHLHAAAFGESTLTFTPLAAGTYAVYCSLPGHKELGMTATLTVK